MNLTSKPKIDFKLGNVEILSELGFLQPIDIFVILDKIMYDLDNAYIEKLYLIGYKKGQELAARFNIKSHSIPIFKALVSRIMIFGLGKYKVTSLNYKAKNCQIKCEWSNYAQAYRELFGLQKKPVDHLMRGLLTGVAKSFFEVDMLGIEVYCRAQNKTSCLFEISSLKNAKALRKKYPGQLPNS